jgi:hypothetical protein
MHEISLPAAVESGQPLPAERHQRHVNGADGTWDFRELPALPPVAADSDRGSIMAAGPTPAGKTDAAEYGHHPRAVVADANRCTHECAARQIKVAHRTGRNAAFDEFERPPAQQALVLVARGLRCVGEEHPALRADQDHRVLLGTRDIAAHLDRRAPPGVALRQRGNVDRYIRGSFQRATEPSAGQRAIRQPA